MVKPPPVRYIDQLNHIETNYLTLLEASSIAPRAAAPTAISAIGWPGYPART